MVPLILLFPATISVLFNSDLRPIGYSGFTYETGNDDFQWIKLERRFNNLLHRCLQGNKYYCYFLLVAVPWIQAVLM